MESVKNGLSFKKSFSGAIVKCLGVKCKAHNYKTFGKCLKYLLNIWKMISHMPDKYLKKMFWPSR